MNRDEHINQIRKKDHEMLRTFKKISVSVQNAAMDKLMYQIADLQAGLEALQDEKEALLRGPMSKRELLSFATECLAQSKADVTHLLRGHLKDCLSGHDTPFNEFAMKHLFSDDKAFKLAFLFLTEDVVGEIINGLDESGVSANEKEARIKKIDVEIDQIVKELQKTNG